MNTVIARILISTACILTSCTTSTIPHNVSATGSATVYFEPEGRVSLFNKSIDSVEQGSFEYGFTVASGDRLVSMVYEIKESCPMFSVNCIERISKGTCSGTLHAIPEHTYGIRVSSADRLAVISIYDKAMDDKAGEGSCTPGGQDFDTTKYRKLPRAY